MKQPKTVPYKEGFAPHQEPVIPISEWQEYNDPDGAFSTAHKLDMEEHLDKMKVKYVVANSCDTWHGSFETKDEAIKYCLSQEQKWSSMWVGREETYEGYSLIADITEIKRTNG